ncbi:DUF58 domain-containing protein [Pseudomonas sp. HR96]|uniref:DUF58 domain-containing protein n=1 Tax=Pseudomonas sp. HR96 TaxID=1027966 RepID=UPI002A762E72|nr:DUF58 domain-containing protein [Pseudomonas sp. HR96]WPO98096.1 DUF58 domain-containing protein [Pseudomonas sp. HR96]
MQDNPSPWHGVQVSLAELMALEFKARGLSLLAHQPRASLLAGNHGSRLRGRGLDFEELRRYQPGDDLRALDWRASSRRGLPYVKTYHEERDRPALLLVDQRMNMYFGSQRSFKSVLAAELAALLGWMAWQAGDRVGGLVFNDARIEAIAPRRSRQSVAALLAAISRQNAALSADSVLADAPGQLDLALRRCVQGGGHDQLICIVSDFAGCTEASVQLLRQLAAHNDVLALQVYDPLALRLPERGRVLVTQGQLQVELTLDRATVRKPLGDYLQGRLREVAELLRRSRVPLLMFSSGEEAPLQLRRELGREPRRGARSPV